MKPWMKNTAKVVYALVQTLAILSIWYTGIVIWATYGINNAEAIGELGQFILFMYALFPLASLWVITTTVVRK